MEPLLRVEKLRVDYGGVVALRDISFDVNEGETLGIIGPNGAGKTTLFNCLTCLVRPKTGHVAMAGAPLSRRQPHELVGLGMARTFQNLATFGWMTVLENIMVGGHARAGGSDLWLTPVQGKAERQRQDALREHACALADKMELTDVLHSYAAGLPYSVLKRVEIARALAAKPRLLLLDEPAGGLSATEIAALARLIEDLRARERLTILLVEHHMGLVFQTCARVVVLNFGTLLLDAPPQVARTHPEVLSAYLGTAT